MSAGVTVREYKDANAFNRDAESMAAAGWEVASFTERTERRSCLGIILSFGLLLIRPPKPHIVVTYRYTGGPGDGGGSGDEERQYRRRRH